MKLTKTKLRELIKQTIKELNFDSQEAFQKYNAKHKMRPGTKVNVGGKKTTAGKASGGIDLKKGDKNHPIAKSVSSIKSPKDLKKLFPKAEPVQKKLSHVFYDTGEKDAKGKPVYAKFYFGDKKGKSLQRSDSFNADDVDTSKLFPASIYSRSGEIKV